MILAIGKQYVCRVPAAFLRQIAKGVIYQRPKNVKKLKHTVLVWGNWKTIWFV